MMLWGNQDASGADGAAPRRARTARARWVVWNRDRGVRAALEAEIATRALLARAVYGVPDEWLDDVVRVRLARLEEEA
jgi:hypothetical protein